MCLFASAADVFFFFYISSSIFFPFISYVASNPCAFKCTWKIISLAWLCCVWKMDSVPSANWKTANGSSARLCTSVNICSLGLAFLNRVAFTCRYNSRTDRVRASKAVYQKFKETERKRTIFDNNQIIQKQQENHHTNERERDIYTHAKVDLSRNNGAYHFYGKRVQLLGCDYPTHGWIWDQSVECIWTNVWTHPCQTWWAWWLQMVMIVVGTNEWTNERTN